MFFHSRASHIIAALHLLILSSILFAMTMPQDGRHGTFLTRYFANIPFDACQNTMYTTVPAVSNTTSNSCGTTAATIVGTDQAGKVTVGATSGTSYTITFVTPFTTAPSCMITNETTANIARTTTTILNGTFVAVDVLAYQCDTYF